MKQNEWEKEWKELFKYSKGQVVEFDNFSEVTESFIRSQRSQLLKSLVEEVYSMKVSLRLSMHPKNHDRKMLLEQLDDVIKLLEKYEE